MSQSNRRRSTQATHANSTGFATPGFVTVILILIALLAVACAVFAGYRLKTEGIEVFPKQVEPTVAPAAPDTTSEQVAAVVNDHALTADYVNQQIESLPVGQQTALLSNMDKFIESLIQEETLFQSMLIEDFKTEPDLREAVKTQVVNYLIDKHVTNGVVITEAMVKEYYEANTSSIREEHVAASHIVLAQREECDALATSIQSDDEFSTAAQEKSLDTTTATAGGHIGLFMNHSGDLGFEEALFDMKVGEMQVFESQQGCHLVRVTDHVIPPLPPLAEVSERIAVLLKRRENGTALQNLLRRSESGVTVVR